MVFSSPEALWIVSVGNSDGSLVPFLLLQQ